MLLRLSGTSGKRERERERDWDWYEPMRIGIFDVIEEG